MTNSPSKDNCWHLYLPPTYIIHVFPICFISFPYHSLPPIIRASLSPTSIIQSPPPLTYMFLVHLSMHSQISLISPIHISSISPIHLVFIQLPHLSHTLSSLLYIHLLHLCYSSHTSLSFLLYIFLTELCLPYINLFSVIHLSHIDLSYIDPIHWLLHLSNTSLTYISHIWYTSLISATHLPYLFVIHVDHKYMSCMYVISHIHLSSHIYICHLTYTSVISNIHL